MSDPGYLAELYQTRDQYRSNAEEAILAREFRKASELLWGAVTQQLKALAAACNVIIQSHREFFDFLRQLSVELQDKQIYEDFIVLNALHKNFYDETIPPDALPGFYDKAVRFISHLDELTKTRK